MAVELSIFFLKSAWSVAHSTYSDSANTSGRRASARRDAQAKCRDAPPAPELARQQSAATLCWRALLPSPLRQLRRLAGRPRWRNLLGPSAWRSGAQPDAAAGAAGAGAAGAGGWAALGAGAAAAFGAALPRPRLPRGASSAAPRGASAVAAAAWRSGGAFAFAAAFAFAFGSAPPGAAAATSGAAACGGAAGAALADAAFALRVLFSSVFSFLASLQKKVVLHPGKKQAKGGALLSSKVGRGRTSPCPAASSPPPPRPAVRCSVEPFRTLYSQIWRSPSSCLHSNSRRWSSAVTPSLSSMMSLMSSTVLLAATFSVIVFPVSVLTNIWKGSPPTPVPWSSSGGG
eukprot:9503844-Pyramimonas_sp.AAC.5